MIIQKSHKTTIKELSSVNIYKKLEKVLITKNLQFIHIIEL